MFALRASSIIITSVGGFTIANTVGWQSWKTVPPDKQGEIPYDEISRQLQDGSLGTQIQQ